MPPRKKPHPRSLDALFGPKPRTVAKAPVKRCAGGHRQSASWKAGHGCSTCERDESARLRSEIAAREAAADRAAWSAANPTPAVLVMVVTSTGRVIRHSIPKHLMRRPGTRGRRRR